MPESPNRQRLAELMEQRRKDLRLRWQDVAERSGLSLKTLHSVRSSDKRVAELTKTGIEDGLRWEHGSIDLVLAGGDPVPLSSDAPGLHGAVPLSVPPGEAADIATTILARRYDVNPDDPADPWLRPVRQEIADAIMVHGADATGSEIFHGRPASAIEAAIWDDPRASRKSKELFIAVMRADRAAYEDGHGNGVSRIGLAPPVASGVT